VEEKETMKDLLKQHSHPSITFDIRRELFSSRSRGDLEPAQEMEVDM